VAAVQIVALDAAEIDALAPNHRKCLGRKDI